MAQGETVSSRGRVNIRSLLIGAAVIVIVAAAATLFGWDLVGWLEEVWDTITTISIGYLIAGIVLITAQTTAAGFAVPSRPGLILASFLPSLRRPAGEALFFDSRLGGSR